jgi:hypothetical protein
VLCENSIYVCVVCARFQSPKVLKESSKGFSARGHTETDSTVRYRYAWSRTRVRESVRSGGLYSFV